MLSEAGKTKMGERRASLGRSGGSLLEAFHSNKREGGGMCADIMRIQGRFKLQ